MNNNLTIISSRIRMLQSEGITKANRKELKRLQKKLKESSYKTGYCKLCNSENWITNTDNKPFLCYDCKKKLSKNKKLIKEYYRL